MLKFLFILISFLSFLTIRAQQVTNIEITQESDKVVITYDITSNKAGQTFDIKVKCSADGGKTFSINPQSITGDLTSVSTGTGKRIVWDVLSERQELAGDHFVFQLVATDPFSGSSGTFTDSRDGEVYKWVKIGDQVWMAENLRTTKYRDSTNIPNVTDYEAWSKLKTPGYCWYNNEITNRNKYGALYNWHTVNTDKLAPKGWHVTTDAEWTTLVNYLGFLKRIKMPRDEGESFTKPNTGAKNESGLISHLGGFCMTAWGVFDNSIQFRLIDEVGDFWTTSEGKYPGDIIEWSISCDKNIHLHRNDFSSKGAGQSVRCIKD
jgi:uncharacterized protein (TIGR02145 family)